jgi:hypothetical protein
MPFADREKIVKAIQEIAPGSPVLRTLKISALQPAQDSDYDVVRKAAGLAEPVVEPSK